MNSGARCRDLDPRSSRRRASPSRALKVLFIEGPGSNCTMNVDELRHYLDGLIETTRRSFSDVDSSMREIAGVIDRYGQAEADIIAIRDMLRQRRQPLPMQPVPGQPLPQAAPTAAQEAERIEQERWAEFRRTAGIAPNGG